MDEHLRRLQQNIKKGEDVRAERDRLIVTAQAAGVPVVRIAEVAGLTRQHIHRIITAHSSRGPDS